MSVRIIVNNAPGTSSVVASEVGISPVVISVLGGGGGGDTTPVEGISPARAVPESMPAKRTANAKCLILRFSFELRMPIHWHKISIV